MAGRIFVDANDGLGDARDAVYGDRVRGDRDDENLVIEDAGRIGSPPPKTCLIEFRVGVIDVEAHPPPRIIWVLASVVIGAGVCAKDSELALDRLRESPVYAEASDGFFGDGEPQHASADHLVHVGDVYLKPGGSDGPR
jgi:hypothetical protein